MVTWLIVVVVILAVIGPVVSMIPSSRDRRQAQLRQRALVRGLRVEKVEEEPLRGWRYRLDRLKPASDPYLDEPVTVNDQRLQAWAGHLPKGVLEFRLRPGSVTVTWDEQGTVEDVERLAAALKHLADCSQ